MEFSYFRYFLVVAEEMNFHRAAEKLYITQQSLSAHIQKLERHYGAQMFVRKPRLRLTPAGEALVEYARHALRNEDLFRAKLTDLSDTVTGHLNVGITGIRGTIFMPRIWELFHREYPNITLSLTEASTTRLDSLLERGSIDLYIGVDAPERSYTEVQVLSMEKICCIASQSFLDGYFGDRGQGLSEKAREGGLEVSDLHDLPIVTFNRGNSIRDVLEVAFQNEGTYPRIILETSRHDLVLRFCQQGSGIGLTYQMILYDLLRSMRDVSNLHVFPMKNFFSPKYTSIVYLREDFKPRYMTGFIKTVRNVFRDYAENANIVIHHSVQG